MKKIGITSAGSVIVEMSPQEYDAFEASLSSKKSVVKPFHDAKDMSAREIAEYAAPRLRKLGAKKKDGVLRCIATMFLTTGGIEEEKILQTFTELVKMQVLRERDEKITYNRS